MLFEFSDCTGGTGGKGGKPKVEAAAAALRRIYPKVEVAAHQLTIPMPGHTLESSSSSATTAAAAAAAAATGTAAGATAITYAEEMASTVATLERWCFVGISLFFL
jgi:hypothetical protein